MHPEAPAPSPVPPGPLPPDPVPPPADAWPREEAWPPEDEGDDAADLPWPDEPQGTPAPWPDDRDGEEPALDPWPAGPGHEPPPDDLFPDPEEPTDPAFDLPDERDPRLAPADGRRILGLQEEVVLAGGCTVLGLCDTGRARSVLAARLDTTGAGPTLHLRGGTILPARPAPGGGFLLDLVIAGISLPGVRLELAEPSGGPELLLGRDLLSGRFLVDPAGF